MEVKERHRGIKGKLDPKRERTGSAVAKIFFTPVPKQDQAGRDRVKKTTLSHEHRQRNTFPRDVVDVLIVDEFEIAKKLEARETAVEKKTGNREATAPTIERVTRGH